MGLGKNISEFRKKKGFTQEELGARLGVSNQAVSKWENETSLPDVMLLPALADALGVTLNALYGIEEKKPDKVPADDFPLAAWELLKDYFTEQAGAKMAIGAELGTRVLSCVSNTAGTVFISKDFAYLDTGFKTPVSETLFTRPELASAMKKLEDPDVRKVLAYMYRANIAADKTTCGTFLIPEIAAGCSMDENDVLEAVEKLTALHLIDSSWFHDGVTEYYFSIHYAQFALVIFRALALLASDGFSYLLLRDTSKILDYLFEKLRK